MTSNFQQYPTHLNPFGDEDGEESNEQSSSNVKKNPLEDYPDYLSPFGDDGNEISSKIKTSGPVDDYDDSLNPFGDEITDDKCSIVADIKGDSKNYIADNYPSEVNPFEQEGESNEDLKQEDSLKEQDKNIEDKMCNLDDKTNREELNNGPIEKSIDQINNDRVGLPIKGNFNSQPDSLEPPPVPLPRTKSLLKKRQLQNQQQQLQQQQLAAKNDTQQTISSLSSTSSTSLSSLSTATTVSNNNVNNNVNAISAESTNTTATFQRRKNKRNAPPVPVNFKRQVSGSLDAIDEELNVICDKLEKIDKESRHYQAKLKVSLLISESKSNKNRTKIEELARRKNSVIRRQKELMYKKREINLDQIHSDIEYELRMIGNKQLSNRTLEDEAREKELLKKLVEIVEEKSDIVENLNKI